MLENNPFFILGLEPTATRHQVERQGQKLLAMLEVGFAEIEHYQTPLGPRRRTSEAVRQAMATLRDPDKRLLAELWAETPTPTQDCPAEMEGQDNNEHGSKQQSAVGGFAQAMAALGFR